MVAGELGERESRTHDALLVASSWRAAMYERVNVMSCVDVSANSEKRSLDVGTPMSKVPSRLARQGRPISHYVGQFSEGKRIAKNNIGVNKHEDVCRAFYCPVYLIK